MEQQWNPIGPDSRPQGVPACCGLGRNSGAAGKTLLRQYNEKRWIFPASSLKQERRRLFGHAIVLLENNISIQVTWIGLETTR
jgi:hypothetical protein